NRSANATWVKPSATARATAVAIACSYFSFAQGDGMGTFHSGSPSASAWASSSSILTACIATRPAVSLTVVNSPATSVSLRERSAVPQLDDHFWRARQHRFCAHADRLSFDVADGIGAARRFEHVVQKSVAAAGVDAAQRSRFASKDEQRLRARAARDPGADRAELPLDAIGQLLRLRRESNLRAEGSNGLRDVAQPAVHIGEDRNAGGLELPFELRLRGVDDHEVRLQREQPLDVRIDQAAEARKMFDVGRKAIVTADAGQAVARPHGEEHLSRRGHER